MLQIKDQNDYNPALFKLFKNNFNINMFNLANSQIDLISNIPKDINVLSNITDKLSNLVIISGTCYFFNKGNNFKVIENNNVIFNKETNTFKLKSLVSYKIEPKENKTYFVSEKQSRIYDKNKSKLKHIEDMVIRKESINITTSENNYKYTLMLNFNNITSVNNVTLKLNEETISYPNISEIYYINNRREKVNIKILNNNKLSFNLDLNKNINNIYEIDLETVETDNINIVFEDTGLDLIIDEVNCNYTEYVKEGYIVLEALISDYPILKVGLEGDSDTNTIEFLISHDTKDWIPIELSNTYQVVDKNKVISFNTINDNSIKVEKDVKTIYLRINLKSFEQILNTYEQVNREIFNTANFNTRAFDYESYSLYEDNNSINYGNISETSKFNFKDLFKNGEYVIINNNYYIKGFKETDISKTYDSQYYNSYVSLKSNYKRVTGNIIKFDKIDIATKEIYNFNIVKIFRNLADKTEVKFVLPLKNTVKQTIYYLKYEDKEIEVDLRLGFINSALDVLYCLDTNDSKVYLLDENKNLIKELPTFTFEKDGKQYRLMSLLDADLFETVENISKTYPLNNLNDYEIGLFENKLESFQKERNINCYVLELKKLYNEDVISDINKNYSKIVSIEDYNLNIKTATEIIPDNTKQYKTFKQNIIKGSIIIEEID